jgi:hypothetical protein
VKRAFLLPFKNKRRHESAVIRELRSIASTIKNGRSPEA